MDKSSSELCNKLKSGEYTLFKDGNAINRRAKSGRDRKHVKNNYEYSEGGSNKQVDR